MSSSFVSTQYLANCLVLPVQQAQAQLATAVTEESTGEYANLGLRLGDQAGYELSLKAQVQQLQALTTGNSVVATNLSTAQSALTSIASSAQSTVQSLATWTQSANAGAQLQTMGETALKGLISSANVASGGAYVFGGTNFSQAPLNDYFATGSTAKQAVEAAFSSTFGCLPTDAAAASITATQMQGFLSGPFAALFSGSNWTADWSNASATNTTATIAPGQTVATSMSTTPASATAATPFQTLAQAFTMLAEFGGSELSLSAQQAVASTATSLITKGQYALTNAQAKLGATQSQVTDANSAMSAQITLVEQQVNTLDAVDQTATAAKITSLTNQIQMAYELTARLQQLNLAQYLPVA